MNREKQIGEMARTYEEAMYKARGTLGSMNEGEARWYVKALYNAGYRKATDVSREITDHIEAILNKMFEQYAVLGQTDYCTITEIIWRELSAELKKKYTEVQTDDN